MGTSPQDTPGRSWTGCARTSRPARHRRGGCRVHRERDGGAGARSCAPGRWRRAHGWWSLRPSGAPTSSCWRPTAHVPDLLPVDGAGVIDLEGLDRPPGRRPARRGARRPRGRPPGSGAAGRRGRRAGPPARRTRLARRRPVRRTRRRTARRRRGLRDQPQVADRPTRRGDAGGGGAQHRPRLRVRRPAKYPDGPLVHLLESVEAHVAGRVGLGTAVREYLELGPAAVADQPRRRRVATLREMVASSPAGRSCTPTLPPARPPRCGRPRDRTSEPHARTAAARPPHPDHAVPALACAGGDG